MNNPNPVPPTPPEPPGWQPSGSTIGSGAGGALAVILVELWSHWWKESLDAGTVAAVTTLCSTLAGYFMEGGRK